MSRVPTGHVRNLVPDGGLSGHGIGAGTAWFGRAVGPIGHGRNLVPDWSEGGTS
jgi:hypothetical protein